MTEPDDDAFERRVDAAYELLNTREADEFAKALDVLGWMIAQQEPEGGRWMMNGVSDDCPPWADELGPP